MKKWGKVAGALVMLVVIISLGASALVKDSQPLRKAKPNVVIILSDDQGFGDVSYHEHPKEIKTPAIDKLAAQGVVFTNGYASAFVCAPTRAGLLSGRYQQRFGFYRASDSRVGMPLNEITLADVLKKEGYTTGAFGKWHLGLTKEYHPCSRGFDEFYGFLGHGAHDYFDYSCAEDADDFHQCIYRNFNTISDEGYLTDNLAKEASSFIEKNAKKENPFFLYLPFNAVHTPMQAPEEDIARYNTGDKKRDILLAMIYRMDVAIEQVISTLKKESVYDNTIIFFLSDNGGAKASGANNLPLRDFKQSVYEGGLRVPFIMSWPDKLKHGVCDEPVISFDIMPTICAALKIEMPDGIIYDGKNMLPAISGDLRQPLHNELYFDGNDISWAVREGDWKLLYSKKGNLELYNLDFDLSEQNNLVLQNAGKTDELKSKYEKWRSEMGKPIRTNNKKKKK